MLLEDLKSIVNDLKEIPTYRTNPVRVEVLDVTTGITTKYPTKKAARLALQCSREALHVGRTKLYKKRYQITVSNTAEN